jgi:flavin-dependent dehydrogenase
LFSEEAKFDVVIVGAGPAGAFAAEKLAEGGARVALFDGRDPEVGKPCGGGVTAKALKRWPFITEAGGRLVDSVEMYSPAGRRVKLKLREPFAIYSRRSFDDYLRARASAAGASVLHERVRLDEEKGADGLWRLRSKRGACWSGSILVAADGANSPIAKRLAGPLSNSEMEVAFGYRTPCDAAQDWPTVIAFLPGWAGYAWAFPRLDHISFGIATAQDTFEHKQLDEFLWSFMIGYFRGREEGAATGWPRRGRARMKGDEEREVEDRLRLTAQRYAARIPGLSPETLAERKAAGSDWALVGDAAGFADPVTGEGIYYALRSAEILAEAYARGRVADYEEMWRADFGRELRRASQMRKRFYGRFLGDAFTERMISIAGLHPGIRRTLRELIAGGQDYTSLKRTLARRAFLPF